MHACLPSESCVGFERVDSCSAPGQPIGVCCQLKQMPPTNGGDGGDFVSLDDNYIQVRSGTSSVSSSSTAGALSLYVGGRSASRGAAGTAAEAAAAALTKSSAVVDCSLNPFFLGCGPPQSAVGRSTSSNGDSATAAVDCDECATYGGFLAGCSVCLSPSPSSGPSPNASPSPAQSPPALGDTVCSGSGDDKISVGVFIGVLIGCIFATMFLTALIVGYSLAAKPERAQRAHNSLKRMGSGSTKAVEVAVPKAEDASFTKQVSMTFERDAGDDPLPSPAPSPPGSIALELPEDAVIGDTQAIFVASE